jgi:formate dehydrogenase iron-sulfur subunit
MKGFIYNKDLCTGCKSCSAACTLENRWNVKIRRIYAYNGEAFLPEPVINLSMACNHCKAPLCLTGCPTSTFYRDTQSQAILTDNGKCIGCRYCLWNCPYNAPVLSSEKGYIEKCHFCFHRLNEGTEPACTSACPTGALHFGEIPDKNGTDRVSWMPSRNINPALHLTGERDIIPLKIIPDTTLTEGTSSVNPIMTKNISKEWSLIAFTFLISVSSGINIAGLAGNINPTGLVPLLLLILAGIFSVFHLKLPFRAWRAINNIRSSALSREIILFLVYGTLLFIILIFNNSVIRVITPFTGLLLLLSIDNVYTYSDKSPWLFLHSGQSFLTGLLVASFVMNALLPFLFVASIKLLYNLIVLYKFSNENYFYFAIRFIRIAFLILSLIIIVTGVEKRLIAGYAVFLTGELIDRIMYYVDFKPINISNSFIETIIPTRYEEERN